MYTSTVNQVLVKFNLSISWNAENNLHEVRDRWRSSGSYNRIILLLLLVRLSGVSMECNLAAMASVVGYSCTH